MDTLIAHTAGSTVGGKGSGRRPAAATTGVIVNASGAVIGTTRPIAHGGGGFEPPSSPLPAPPPPLPRGKRVRDNVVVTPAPKQIRSEGQRLLLNARGSLGDIASALGEGTSRQSVLDWRNGTSQPGYGARARMETALGIPVETWGQRPHPDFEVPDMPYTTHDAPPEGGTSLQDCMRLLDTVRREAGRSGLLPSERIKLVDAEAKLLKLRVELESHAELTEDRYVREHPAWLRIRNAISDALKAHPAAAEAVAVALERLGV